MKVLLALVLVIGLVAVGVWLIRGRGEPEPAPPVRDELPKQPDAEPQTGGRTASEPLPDLVGQVSAISCRQGECHWQRVLRLERVRQVPQGELRRIVVRTGRSDNGTDPEDVAWEEGEQTSYLFCSRERPAYGFPSDGEGGPLIIHYLDLFNLAGYQQASATVYMRGCHGRDYEEGMDLRALGYRPGTRDEQVEGGSPEDLDRF